MNNDDIRMTFINEIESTKKKVKLYIILLILSLVGLFCSYYFNSELSKLTSFYILPDLLILLFFFLSYKSFFKIINCNKSIKYNKEKLLEDEIDLKIIKRQ